MVTPTALDGAEVLEVARVSPDQSSGRTRHFGAVPSDAQDNLTNGFITRLAMARYAADAAAGEVYLFYCDDSWTVLTDTLHDSVEAARAQSIFEYPSVDWAAV